MKNTEKLEEIENKDDKNDKIKLEIKENDGNMPGSQRTDNVLHKDTKLEQVNKDNKKEKKPKNIETINITLTLLFSLLLLVVSFAQYMTYNRQANIAANANKLAQYQYRFEFYEKLEDLQKDVSIIKKKPQLDDIEQFSELNYKILSLYRESALLFDKNISKDINKILEEHLNFLNELNNTGLSQDDYEKEMKNLNMEYGNFINSDNFKKYLDINAIE
ncbi:hypothetical protein DWC20_08805 [Clostridium botulinum]|uniref:hypothetical protein n=1 Tax=Clostridium botulinum TaxID=1491 RepID=UPI00037E1EF9|nr:hypothetical protein [Clostridium botulinum]MBN1035643.1 hypothetical protein [Clostridium botulinum]NFO12246.1 hypothetical protein [Clostridium botulinum]